LGQCRSWTISAQGEHEADNVWCPVINAAILAGLDSRAPSLNLEVDHFKNFAKVERTPFRLDR
jgi:hypothetical protein